VLCRFDTGDPALLELSVGKGKLYLLTSGWQPEDSQFALSSKFVPLLYSFLELSRPDAAEQSNYLVGDSVPLPDSTDPLVIYTPGGQSMTVPAGTKQFAGTSMPGIYQVASGRQTNYLAVNVDPAESRTAPIAAEQLEVLGAPIGPETPSLLARRAPSPRLQAAELER